MTKNNAAFDHDDIVSLFRAMHRQLKGHVATERQYVIDCLLGWPTIGRGVGSTAGEELDYRIRAFRSAVDELEDNGFVTLLQADRHLHQLITRK